MIKYLAKAFTGSRAEAMFNKKKGHFWMCAPEQETTARENLSKSMSNDSLGISTFLVNRQL